MRAVFQKIIPLYEELEVAGVSATLTFSTRGSKSTAKLQIESSLSPTPSTSTPTPTLPPAPGKPRRHHGAKARVRRYQRAAANQTFLAEAISVA